MLRVCFLIIIIFLSIFNFSFAQEKKIKKNFHEAISAQDYETAIIEAKKWVALEPEKLFPVKMLSNAYASNEQWIEAAETMETMLPIYEKTINKSKKLPSSFVNDMKFLSLVNIQAKRYDEAYDTILLTKELYKKYRPKNLTYLIELDKQIAQLYIIQAKYDEAIPLYNSIIETIQKAENPNTESINTLKYTLGRTYLDTNQFQDSLPLIIAYTSYISENMGERNLTISAAYMNLSRAYFGLQNYNEALKYNKKHLIAYFDYYDDIASLNSNQTLKPSGINYKGNDWLKKTLPERQIIGSKLFLEEFDSYAYSDNILLKGSLYVFLAHAQRVLEDTISASLNYQQGIDIYKEYLGEDHEETVAITKMQKETQARMLTTPSKPIVKQDSLIQTPTFDTNINLLGTNSKPKKDLITPSIQ